MTGFFALIEQDFKRLLTNALFWVITATLLTAAVATPMFGRLGDMYGPKPILIICAVLLFGGLWGFWGVFFAIPLATLFKAVINAWPRTEPVAAE